MATRSEREKAQKQNEHHQNILDHLLKEEENRTCADCGAKGPRWASWSLGVFMCIRCAGIHRNLGVHISRVKSVNLDQWTSEQIQGMVEMGNLRARSVYEFNLPDDFRRPQSDQAAEVFIRDKYERKRFFNKDALPVKSPEASAPVSPSPEKTKAEKDKRREEKKPEKNKEKNQCKSPKKSPDKKPELLGSDVPDVPNLLGPEVSNPPAPPQAGADPVPPDAEVKTEEQKPKKKLMSKNSILSLYNNAPAPGGFVQQQIPNGAMTAGQGGAVTTGQGGAVIAGQGGATVGADQMCQQVSSMSVTSSSSTAPPSGQTLSNQLWK